MRSMWWIIISCVFCWFNQLNEIFLCIYVTLKLGRVDIACFPWEENRWNMNWNLLDVNGCTVNLWPMTIWKSDSQYYVVFCICCNLKGLLVTGLSLFLLHGTDRWINYWMIAWSLHWSDKFLILWLATNEPFGFNCLLCYIIWFEKFNTVDTCYLESLLKVKCISD